MAVRNGKWDHQETTGIGTPEGRGRIEVGSALDGIGAMWPSGREERIDLQFATPGQIHSLVRARLLLARHPAYLSLVRKELK